MTRIIIKAILICGILLAVTVTVILIKFPLNKVTPETSSAPTNSKASYTYYYSKPPEEKAQEENPDIYFNNQK